MAIIQIRIPVRKANGFRYYDLLLFQFNNNPFLAMSSSDWEKTPSSKMFKTLYKYIIGLNEDSKEIEMTRPGKISSHPYTNFESTNLQFFCSLLTFSYKVQIFTSDQNRQKKMAKKTI
jgi:hypothetical protein